MSRIQHWIVCQPEQGIVPASVFFASDGQGTTRGLYFGLAGGGTFDEAYFRMDVSTRGVEHFLECDNPEDDAFLHDRAAKARRRKEALLSPVDAQVFAELRTCRMSWWSFEDGDAVRMHPSRMNALKRMPSASAAQPGEPPLFYARSRALNPEVLAQIRAHWSLEGF